MGENFSRLKRKALWYRCIKSVLAGLACGLLSAGVLSLLIKLELLAFKPSLSLAVGGAVLLLVGLAVFLGLHTSDRTLARRLDEQNDLKEKTQTMLAYQKEDGALYELQRMDADAALAGLSRKGLRARGLWICILAFVLGAAVFIGAAAYTPAEDPPPPPVPDKEFAITELQIAAMEELIAYVQASEMASPYRETVASTLTKLLADLRLATTEPQRDAALTPAIETIYEQTGCSSAALELMEALWKSESDGAKRLAEALNYYDWHSASEWEDFSANLANVRATLITSGTDTERQILLTKLASQIQAALSAEEIDQNDPLAVTLSRLASANETNPNGTHIYGLSTLSAMTATLGDVDTQRELDATFTALGAELFRALSQHAASTGTGEYAMKRLSELFGCTHPAFERPQFYDVSTDEPNTDSGSEGGGVGAIGGGAVYGSDDTVFDPYTGTYVEYGTILDKYYALMFGKLQDGDYTDEEKEALEKYFDILYGGFDEKDEE